MEDENYLQFLQKQEERRRAVFMDINGVNKMKNKMQPTEYQFAQVFNNFQLTVKIYELTSGKFCGRLKIIDKMNGGNMIFIERTADCAHVVLNMLKSASFGLSAVEQAIDGLEI